VTTGTFDGPDPMGDKRSARTMSSTPVTRTPVHKTRGDGSAAGNRAKRAAFIVEIFGWNIAILGAIAGIIIAAQSETTYLGVKDYPYIDYGIGVITAAIVYGATIIMVGAYIQWRVRSATVARN
jgi:hypothetical protein